MGYVVKQVMALFCILSLVLLSFLLFRHPTIGFTHLQYPHNTIQRWWSIDKTNTSKEDMGYIVTQRNHRLENECRKHPELSKYNIQPYLLVDDEYRILYCPVAKTGTSNWRRVLLVLRHTFQNVIDIGPGVAYRYRYKSLASYSQKQKLFRLQNYTKFMFVRHPFTRLLSAFRDKFVETPTEMFRKKYVPIAKKILNLRSPGDNLTFSQFVQYLLKIPPQTYNRHWRPMHYLCQPCAINYDVIGKFETLNMDTEYTLAKIGAEEIEFPNIIPHKTNSSSVDAMMEYYSQLTHEEIEKLYKTYQLDFEMFGYDVPDYLKFSKQQN
ncbi:carbohydrate sulfotransferase 11-like [Glandiceps talaboti]